MKRTKSLHPADKKKQRPRTADLYKSAFEQMTKLSMTDVDLRDKRVLIRVDFNVPMKSGVIINNQMIVASLPTIRHVLERGCHCVVLMSQLGQPEGRPDPSASMKPVLAELTNLLGRKVTFLEDCVGPKIEAFCLHPPPGTVILLENLAFHIEEEGRGLDHQGNKIKADDNAVAAFRQSLALLGDIYINDAFATAHMPHSSMVGVDLPIKACGLLMKKELHFFQKALETPVKPFFAILGGDKVTTMVSAFDSLLDKVTDILVVGGMAFTFHKVLNNMEIGASMYDEDGAASVETLMENAQARGVCVHLPTDFITGDRFADDAKTAMATVTGGIQDGWMGLDIGYKTNEEFQKLIEGAKTIVWSGPPGVYEFESFSVGSKQMMDAVARATEAGAVSILAGGPTAWCAKKFNSLAKVSHVSTGSLASLELLEGKVLPGVAKLTPPNMKNAQTSRSMTQPTPSAQSHIQCLAPQKFF